MKKFLFTTFSITFFLILCNFSACNHNENPPVTPSSTPYPQADVLPPKSASTPHLPPAQNEQNHTPAPVISNYWSTEDVDISMLNPQKKYVAFTFDDAPRKTLESLVNVFLSFNVDNPDCVASATVFYNGLGIDERSIPIMQTAHVAGLESGNHTYSHFKLTNLTESELIQEINSVDELLQKIDGKSRHLLRAPYGAIDEKIRKISATPILDWSVDTLDWTGVSAKEIFDSVVNGLESGAIILMHDGFENTVEAVKLLLPELKKRGYQVVSVSQLSKAHNCPLRVGGVYTRARRR